MAVIGISCFYHDSSAVCLDSSGNIICAVQEERFTRIKHTKVFPYQSVRYCIDEIFKLGENVGAIIFYENPLMKFERIIRSYVQLQDEGRNEFEKTIAKWLGGHLYQINELSENIKKLLPDFNIDENLYFIEHHASHASSAFFPSPFEEAGILTLDGVGELSTASMGFGDMNGIHLEKRNAISEFIRTILFRFYFPYWF